MAADLAEAMRGTAARAAYSDSLLLATAARNAEKQMQWRAAGRLYDQAARALEPSPHGHDHPDELIFRARARICRAMTGCAHPMRSLADASDYNRRLREEPAA
jgi:hypothetical protein